VIGWMSAASIGFCGIAVAIGLGRSFKEFADYFGLKADMQQSWSRESPPAEQKWVYHPPV
jgi:hypothetical protein